jgi:polysaccharide deacetylase family protein (PEP-CTERM system associated)
MKNILTFDLEDWYHGNFLHDEYGNNASNEDRVIDPTTRILDMLKQTQNTATFFILGEVAEKYPELIREIHRRGHEVASHCYEHRLVYNRTKEDFSCDLEKSVRVLEEIVQEPVLGFRAPYWSVYRENEWVWEVLHAQGIKYDSSLYPFRTYLYGDNCFPRFRYQIQTSVNGRLEEIPPTTLDFYGRRLPFCGGFYFRILPYWFVKWAINRVNRIEQQPVVFYLHPYEIDKNKPRSSNGWRNNFILHANVKKTESKLRRLLTDFRFVSVREFFHFN